MKGNVFFNTFEYVLVWHGCPRLLLSTRSIMWTSSDQASNQGLGSTPRSGEGKFCVPARQNAFCAHLTSPRTFCVEIQIKLNQQTLLLFQVVCFAVIPFIQASDIRTTSCYGMYSSILLLFLSMFCSISWCRVLRASFSNWSLTF